MAVRVDPAVDESRASRVNRTAAAVYRWIGRGWLPVGAKPCGWPVRSAVAGIDRHLADTLVAMKELIGPPAITAVLQLAQGHSVLIERICAAVTAPTAPRPPFPQRRSGGAARLSDLALSGCAVLVVMQTSATAPTWPPSP